MKHKEHKNRKSFAKWATKSTETTPTHRCIQHQFIGMKPFNQTIKLKSK
jgi:hypothetical protein